MKTLTYLLVFFFVGLPVLVGSLYLGIVSDQPIVIADDKILQHQNVRRIKTLIKQNYPRHFRRRHFKIVNIREDDLNLMLNYGMQRFVSGAARLELLDSKAEITASISIPDPLPGSWLNVKTVLKSQGEFEVDIDSIRLGSLTLPGWLLKPVIGFAHAWGQKNDAEYKELIETIKTLRFEKQRLMLVYEWRPELLKKIQVKGEELLMSRTERDRLIAYHNHMVKHTRAFHGRRMELVALLRPMFEFAKSRSQQSGDPVGENRALLLSLAVYANDMNLRHVLSAQKGQGIKYAGYPRITLHQRRDLMQHYLVSAGITVSAGLGIADAFGLAKEISDSMGGSGFSFADLLADRAGVRFALLATQDELSAHAVQSYMSRKNLKESDFMPGILRLPEGLNEQQFKKRYKQVGSSEYNEIKMLIEQRIDACSVFKPGFGRSHS